MPALATCTPETLAGLPCHRVALPQGDSLLVAEHGAQVLQWQAAGRERLFLSPCSRLDGVSAIRGGVPVCWPQFNQRGPLPKHGFARTLPWQLLSFQGDADQAELVLALRDSAATRTHWPHAFEARLALHLQPGQLRITLHIHNTGVETLPFTGALHTYLAVQDVAQATLTGLHGQPEWDALRDTRQPAAAAQTFSAAFDRVYAAPAGPLRLKDGAHALHIAHSPSWASAVVWNPGPDNCAALPDMPADGHRHMLCVEAAQVFEPIQVAPGARWQGWQQLTVA